MLGNRMRESKQFAAGTIIIREDKSIDASNRRGQAIGVSQGGKGGISNNLSCSFQVRETSKEPRPLISSFQDQRLILAMVVMVLDSSCLGLWQVQLTGKAAGKIICIHAQRKKR